MTDTDRIVVPGLSDADQATLDVLWDQLEARKRRNLLRLSYYDGKRAIAQIGTIIPPQYKRMGIVLGWSAKAVDTLARRCNLDGIVWPGGDLDAAGGDVVWDQNHMGAEMSSGIVSSLIHGVSFLINHRGGPGEPPSMIHVKDALHCTGLWNGRTRDLDAVLSVIRRDDRGDVVELALYLPGETVTCVKDGGRWSVTDRQTHPWGVPVEPLVYRPRAGRPFGTSRISRAVMSLHDQALRTTIRMEGHADVFSFPQMLFLGANQSMFQNADGTQKASWQMMLGRVLGIPDDDEAANPRADVKLFQAQSPKPHIDQLRQQAQMFSGETSIPLTSLGVSDMSNPTSADSYIASREDLIAEAEGATDDWSPAIRRSYGRALAILNGEDTVPAAYTGLQPKWRSPVYLSRAAAADAGLKQLQAVPWLADTSVGLELLGLTEQQIDRALSDRRRAEGSGVLATLRDAADRVTADADGV